MDFGHLEIRADQAQLRPDVGVCVVRVVEAVRKHLELKSAAEQLAYPV